MNKDLQYISDFINNAKHLTEKEKADLAKSVKNADKELTISEFKLERTEKVKKTTAILLEETIEELEQKRKAVEAHNRELEIGSALDRVRARAMAMHKSDELLEAGELLYREITKLGIECLTSGYVLIDDKENIGWNYAASPKDGKIMSVPVGIPHMETVVMRAVTQSWKKGEPYSIIQLDPEATIKHQTFIAERSINFPLSAKELISISPERIVLHNFNFTHGYLLIVGGVLLTTEQIDMMVRFSKVFEMTYRRFLDLKKAEAQAREAQIEAALERVRSRSMAMHHTSELQDVINTVHQQLKNLDIAITGGAFIAINEENKNEIACWGAGGTADYVESVHIPFFDRPIYTGLLKCINKGPGFYSEVFSYEEKMEFFNHLFNHPLYTEAPPERKKEIMSRQGGYTRSCVVSKHTSIFIINHHGRKFSEEENNILLRFGKVFEQTYTRFLDLQKAEAQARESQIGLALERIRARTMAMQHSIELSETAQVLYQQFKELGENPDQLSIGTVNENEKVLELWLSVQGNRIEEMFKVPIDEPTVINKIYTAWKEGKKSVVIDISGDELKKYEDFRNHLPEYKTYNDVKNFINKEEARRVIHCAFFPKGLLSLATPEPRPEETRKLLERFAGVFDLTYTRFLDLKKAEAQAREAQIEAALERVRARTMAMHKSEELSKTVTVLFQQLNELGSAPERMNICIIKEDEDILEIWSTEQGGKQINHSFNASLKEPTTIAKTYAGWKEGKKSMIVDLTGKELSDWIHYLKYEMKMPFKEDLKHKRRVHTMAFFSTGMLLISTPELVPQLTVNLLERFADVFNLTYRRFLDLQKAEAQARESEIQLALERVRARTMAMHNSDELAATAKVLFEQFDLLGKIPDRMGIGTINENSKEVDFWLTDQSGNELTHDFSFSIDEPTSMAKFYKAWKEGKDSLVVDLTGKSLKDWLQYVTKEGRLPVNFENIKGRRVHHVAFFSRGFLVLTANERITDEMLQLLVRFAGVFDQTYRRFLDLQKAEAQAREAKIEAALERVRAKAMAMHSSDDLAETVDTFFAELTHLNVMPHRCGVGIINSETRTVDINATTATHENEIKKINGKLKLSGHPVLDKIFENWKLQKEYHPVLMGKEIVEYYKVMNPQVEFPDFAKDEIQYGYYFFFKEGGVFAWTEKKLLEEDLNIFRRFTSVLSLTYRRYLDLKDAEARAVEAVRQTSLDRVRAEIASMRTTEDLNRITPIIWRELKALEVPFIRCGVFIVSDDQTHTQVYLTTPEGKSLGVLNLSTESNALTKNSVEHWKKKQIYKDYWNKEDFINWTKSMMKLGQVQNPETYQGASQPPESLHLHFVPFTQGMLYVGNVAPLTDEKLELVKTLAEAFSIAYARYEDFKNLEEAKVKVEATLKELKSAQAQLVHSEKMASLGELTAGIAHEIKNPLNFVNNFSEVSSELIDEMIEELGKGNNEDVLDIVKDLKQNLEKINHHGKRADSIVKGMLLHSRGTAGEKKPTDINDLLEQYLNLAYHGMRAQNKDFNITIERDYDKTLEKINVVPQDLSRVFLNIINNGCYACTERSRSAANDKKKTGGDGFSPTIKVSTKKLKDKVEIRIADNGNGVPDKIKDKIFQPFFTTKPTGEGTGLGLSLSYDIVTKVHGGELKVETKEGEGTEFIIQIPVKTQ